MPQRKWLPIAIVVGFVLLIRLPFLNQAIQGDDIYYLYGAEHALIDPAHPTHARYAFQGDMVDMRGHPHPPFNSWFLAALLSYFGDVYEVPFHSAYVVFSLIAALSMWSIAKRFSDNPLWATLLFIATSAFVVNGNSLESDLPFLAFWMASIALYVNYRAKPILATTLILASFSALQSIVLTPILLVWTRLTKRTHWWIFALAPPLTLLAWQLYEKATSGELPATVLAGYFSSYGLQQLSNKLRNAAALTAHCGWVVFPALAACRFRERWMWGVAGAIAGAFVDPNPLFWASFGVGIMVITWCVRREQTFLTAWVLIFFASALVLFFAGSARYLLPMAAPICILAAEERRWVPWAFASQLVVSLCLSIVNYQHWDGYRQFASTIPAADSHHRVWVNGEWGLRFYLESKGALPVLRGQTVRPGDTLVASELAYPISITTGGGQLTEVARREITATLPFRIIGIGAKSGYSTASAGLRPFDISTGPIDRVHTSAVIERKPTLTLLPMNAPEASSQIVGGVYDLEGKSRWMAAEAVILLKAPAEPERLHVTFYIAEGPRKVTLALDGQELASGEFTKGMGTLTSARPVTGSTVTITVDKTMQAPGDQRKLGIILTEVGFSK
jgi:hypothetical protein